MKKNISLRDFVYKTLLQRIAITATLIALILVIAATILERQYNNKRIQQLALDGATIVNQSIIDYLDGVNKTSLQTTIDNISRSRLRHPDGHFVYSEIYDTNLQVKAKIEDAEYKYIDSVRSALKNITRTADIKQLPIFKNVKLNDHPHAGVVLPLYDSQQQVKAFILGIYAVSDQAKSAFNEKLIRTVVLVVLIILITSGLLYPVIMRLTNSLSDFSSNLLNANLDMLETLGSAIAKRDSDTNAHNYRVTILAVRLAEKLALTQQQIKGLIKGSFLHDVGKIGISDNILLKPGKLDNDEFTIMKTHVDHGVDIVKNSSWLMML